MPIIIDGYNLLRSVEKTCEDFSSITDIQLCSKVDEYLRLMNEKGEIVFDGIGPPDKSWMNNLSRLEVIYSGRGIEADQVIEDKIKFSSAPKNLIIASSDRRIRDAARLRRAVSVKSDTFWQGVKKQIARKRAKVEPDEKRRGLNKGETDQWLKLFGLDQ